MNDPRTTESLAFEALGRVMAAEYGHVEYASLPDATNDAIALKRFIYDLAGYVGVLPTSLPAVMDEVVYLRDRVAKLEQGASDILDVLDEMLPVNVPDNDDEDCDE